MWKCDRVRYANVLKIRYGWGLAPNQDLWFLRITLTHEGLNLNNLRLQWSWAYTHDQAYGQAWSSWLTFVRAHSRMLSGLRYPCVTYHRSWALLIIVVTDEVLSLNCPCVSSSTFGQRVAYGRSHGHSRSFVTLCRWRPCPIWKNPKSSKSSFLAIQISPNCVLQVCQFKWRFLCPKNCKKIALVSFIVRSWVHFVSELTVP